MLLVEGLINIVSVVSAGTSSCAYLKKGLLLCVTGIVSDGAVTGSDAIGSSWVASMSFVASSDGLI